ncbi:uncharacterized protein LOC144608467 isoform X2 [Rhinoraja longicauda]
MTNYRLDKQRALPCEWTPTFRRSNNNGIFKHEMENYDSSRGMFWNERTKPSQNEIIDQGAQLPDVNQTLIASNQRSNDNSPTGLGPARLQVVADWDVSEHGCHQASEQDVCSRSNTCNLEGRSPVGNDANLAFHFCSQRRLSHRKNSPEPFVTAACLSPCGSPLIQCMELKLSKSPPNRLEKLKERIRLQMKLQKEQQFARTILNLPQEHPIPFHRQKAHKGGSEKCLIRKVTFARPAPTYKGFNAVKLTSEEESSMGVEKSEEALAVNTYTSRRGREPHRDYGYHEADDSVRFSNPEKGRKRQQNSSRDHEASRKVRSCSKITSVKETEKVNGPYSSDIFSWKQSQRLIRKLLGPPPMFPKSPTTTRDTEDRKDEQVEDPMEHARSTPFAKNPRRRLYFANEDERHYNSMKIGSLDAVQPRLESMQVNKSLEGSQLKKTAGMNQDIPWKMRDGGANLEGKSGEDGQKSLVTPKGHKQLLSEDEQGGPNLWSSRSPTDSVMKQKGHLGTKKRPLFPRCRASSSSPLQNKAKMEDETQFPLARSYNTDEVREYMTRQMAKHKRKENERKRSARQAMEMKKKRLQEVYRKQKEAISKQRRWKQRSSRPAQHFVDRCLDSPKPGKNLGSAPLITDRTATKGRRESGHLEESESSQLELHYLTGPFHNSLPGQCSPLKVQDLEPHLCSPKPPSFPLLTNRLLATREQEASGNITSHSVFENRNKQQRLEALRSMANALSGRIEDEVKRLGVEKRTLSGPGTSSNDQQSGDGLCRFVGPDATVTLASDRGMEWQNVPHACLVTPPSMPTDFSLLPKSPYKSGGQVEAERSHNRRAGTGSDLDVNELVDDLLHSPSSRSGDFLWSDSEPSTDPELVCKPNGSSKWLFDADKGLGDMCDDALGTFRQGEHQLERKACVDGTTSDAHQPENTFLGRRRSWETSKMQGGNKSFLLQKSRRLSSHRSPSRTMPVSPPRMKQPASEEESANVERSQNHERTRSPRSVGLSTQSGKPLDDSKPAAGIRKVTTNETKRKENCMTQRLTELMKQFQDETEELSFRCRKNISLKEDSFLEPNRSLVSPESTKHLANTMSWADVEISVNGKGAAQTCATNGSLRQDKLMEQSLWSLLPSESHYRQTMESIKSLHSGDRSVRHAPSNSFSKWEEMGRPFFGNRDTFSRFTLEMAHQYLKEEDLRARHQSALFRLREKALKEKTKAELAWLEQQKTHLLDKGQDDKRPAIIRKQREVLLKLQKEKEEIRHLQSASRVAHEERKLLLKQQQEIFKIHQSTVNLQRQLSLSATGPWFSGVKDASPPTADGEPTRLAGPEPDPGVGSSSPRSLSGSEDGAARDRPEDAHSKLDERFLFQREEELVRRRKQAMGVLAWKRPLDKEEPVVHRTEAEALTTWSPRIREQVPDAWDPSTDDSNVKECSHSPESTKHIEITKVVTRGMDELNGEKQNEKPAETLKQISAVPDPPEKLVMKAVKIQSENNSLINEPAARGTHTSPLRRELASSKEIMYSVQSEQRRRQREKLKMEEAELCRQLEAYDEFISKTKAELNSDTCVNQIQKPQIKIPAAAQYKSQVDLRWLQRSNLLQRSVTRGATIVQSQDLASAQDETDGDVAKAWKSQEIAGAVDLPLPGGFDFDKKLTYDFKLQHRPPSPNPIDKMQSEENHHIVVQICVHPESPDSLDTAIKPPDPPTNCKEEIRQCNKSNYSACYRTKCNNDLLPRKSYIDQNAAIFPSKPREPLFQVKSLSNTSDCWSNHPTMAADHSSQTSCWHMVNSDIKLKPDHGEESEINHSSTVVVNAEDIKENKLGFPIHSANMSGFAPPSIQQPAFEIRPNKPASKEITTVQSPICEQALGPFPLQSSCSLKEDAGLTGWQQSSIRDSSTAETISPTNSLSFIDGVSSPEDKSNYMDQLQLGKREVQLFMKDTFCGNYTFPSLPQEVNSFRSEVVEEVSLPSKDQAPLAEGIKSVALPFLNAEGVLCSQQDLLPVSKSSCRKELLAIPLIDPLTQKQQVSPVAEISFITEELPSPMEEARMLTLIELNSLFDDLILFETEVSSPPAEASISFETEESPLPQEEMICRSEELPSPSQENDIEDITPSSAGNSFKDKSPSCSDHNCKMDTDDLHPLPPPPVEEMVQGRKSNYTVDCPLRTSSGKETSTQFCGDHLLLEPSSIHQSQTEGEMVNHLRCFTIGEQMLVDNKEPDSLKFKGHMLFDAAELDKAEGGCDKIDLKYMECTEKCDNFVTAEQLPHRWDNSDGNTDVSDSEDSSTDGLTMQNLRGLDESLSQAHSFEDEPEEKVKEKSGASQTCDNKLISDQGNHWSGSNDLELERVILECAKAVESFVGSQNLLSAEAEANSEDLVCTLVQHHLVGKDSEQTVNDVEEYLAEHLMEETLGEVTSSGDQENQSTQEKHQIRLCSSELNWQNSQPVKGQIGHGKTYKGVTDPLSIDCVQLQDIIAATGWSQESIEKVTQNLIMEIIDEATKEYEKIKEKHIGNIEAKLILSPWPARECLTPCKMVHNVGISESSQDVGNKELNVLQPFLGTNTHGQMFLLDCWCSVPRRQTEETVFVVPHNFTDVRHLAGNAVDALWSQRGQHQVGNEINELECQNDKDTDEMDADEKCKRVYKQAIFDLTSDIFQNVLIKEPKPKLDPWMKTRSRALIDSGHSFNKEDKTELTSFIQDKVTKLLNLDRNDREKRRIRKLTKYNSKRDRVDIILIQELHEEESDWVEYATDELTVKMRLTEDIFNILVQDTANILSTICGKRLAEQESITSTT